MSHACAQGPPVLALFTLAKVARSFRDGRKDDVDFPTAGRGKLKFEEPE